MSFSNKVYFSDGKYYTRPAACPDGAPVAEYTLNNEGICKHRAEIVDVPTPKVAVYAKPGVNADEPEY